MAFDPGALLTMEELTTPRTPSELARWVDAKCPEFSSNDEASEWVLLRKGIFKKFHEEVFPLSLFANNVFSERSDVLCIPNPGNEDFDARIVDHSTSPPSEIKVEITSAIAGHDEHLRMKYLLHHGHVSVWGRIAASGTETRGHHIQPEDEMDAIDHSDLRACVFSLIKKAARRKSTKCGKKQKYGREHVLVIVFDDWFWFKRYDLEVINRLVESEIAVLPLNFAALYIVGLSGKTCLHFELAGRSGSRT